MKTYSLSNQDEYSLKIYLWISAIVSILIILIPLTLHSKYFALCPLLKSYFTGYGILFLLFSISSYQLRNYLSITWKLRILRYDPYTWIFFFLIFVLSSLNVNPEGKNESVLHLLFFILLSVKAWLLFSDIQFKNEDPEYNPYINFKSGTLFLLILTIYLPFGYIYASRFEPTGDEPHYLLITHSLVTDADIDIANNYKRGDFKNFYSEKLEPQPWEINLKNKSYSYHSIGYSLFLIPGYFLGGRTGAVIQNQLLAVFLSILFLNFLRTSFSDTKSIFIAWIIFTFTSPFLLYSCLLYPEMLAACITFYLYNQFLDHKSKTKLHSGFNLFLLFYISLLKIRFAPLVVFLLCIFFVVNYRFKRIAVCIGCILFLGVTIYFTDLYFLHGILFTANYDPVYAFKEILNIKARLVIKGILSLFIDQELGLFWATPLYLFIVFGIGKIWRTKHRWILFIIFGYVIILVQLKKLGFHGLESPSPRYLVCLLPFFGILLYSGLAEISSEIQKKLFVLLIILTYIFTAFRWCMQQGFFEIADGKNDLLTVLDIQNKYHFQRFFPTIFRNQPEAVWSIIFLIFIATIISIYSAISHSKKSKTYLKINMIDLIRSGILLSGLCLFILYLLDTQIPLTRLEAEDMACKNCISFPADLAWWKRDWHDWESTDIGRELFPENQLSALQNLKTTPEKIIVFANRTGSSDQEPALQIFLCDRLVGIIRVTNKKFTKSEDTKLLFLKSSGKLSLNKWGIYEIIIPVLDCNYPFTINILADEHNTESILINRVEFERKR